MFKNHRHSPGDLYDDEEEEMFCVTSQGGEGFFEAHNQANKSPTVQFELRLFINMGS